MSNNELVLFESADNSVVLSVLVENNNVWLSLDQMSELFQRNKSTISRHIKNVFDEEELDKTSTVAKFATVQIEGNREISRDIEYFNLDMIISVGYRVKSKRGVEFRKWANTVLKEYILKGYSINEKRIKQLGQTVNVLKRAQNNLDGNQILSVVERYSMALDLLDDYDHQTMKRPSGNKDIYTLTYDECLELINTMRFSAESDLFGKEKDDSFKGSIGNIYQSFGGIELYPSLEEKAAHLLYFITKNHSFLDGNKRIAATMFLYFLDKNDSLIRDGAKVIDDRTLVALTIMIAESKPEEMEMMITVIMNCISSEE